MTVSRFAPVVRSTSAVLLRQNRIRGLLAGGVALVLLLSPYRTSQSLVGALAGLTGYVAFVSLATWWVLHRQRVKLSLMSAHGVAGRLHLLHQVLGPVSGLFADGCLDASRHRRHGRLHRRVARAIVHPHEATENRAGR